MSNYVTFDGTASNYITASFTGGSATSTVEVRCRITPSGGWPTAATQRIFGSQNNALEALVTSGGKIQLNVEFATIATGATSTANPPGGTTWIRMIYNVAAGTADFYTSTDTTFDDTAVSWSALGTQVTGLTTGTSDSYTFQRLGSNAGGGGNFTGTMYRVVLIRDGVRLSDYDIWRRRGTDFTDPQGRVWTKTGSALVYTDAAQPHNLSVTGVGT